MMMAPPQSESDLVHCGLEEKLAPTIDVEGNSPSTSPLPETRKKRGISWFLVVASTLSCIFLYAIDNTITANVIPVIAADFQNTDKLAWLSVGFMIGGVAVVLPFGKLYGLFNIKFLYIASVVLFQGGSALCGGAPNISAFIVGRVIAGAGGNGMYLGVMNILSINTNDIERPMYLGLVGLVFGTGTVVGPLIGGGFAESSATWRWGFYINLCVGALFAPVYLFLIPGFDPRGSQKIRSRFRDFDYLGGILSIAVLACIIMAINFGGPMYDWNSPQIIVLFVLSGVLSLVFGFQQVLCFMTKEEHRMFPVSFLKMKEAVLLFICMAASNAGGFIPIYYIPTYFAFVRGDEPMHSAVRLLPLIIFISVVILVNGALMSKFGYYQPWYVAGSALVIVGGVLFSRVDANTPARDIYGYEVLAGIGTGCYIQAGYAVMQSLIELSMTANAISFMMLAQLLGITFGLSISGAVFVNYALNGLLKAIPNVTHDEIESALLGVRGDILGSLPANIQVASLTVIVEAIKKVYILVYVSGAVGFVTSIFLNRKGKVHA
ncbi:MFS drug efflux transporter [Histoplasma capsulatum var. duboisii H88]|uniref:MFS drug efflux transporter n=2 Tax=Ajellomyces capsulatus (strain H88) TaxID=544711 RepID=A0A8A1LCT6_AJEC8|nr:MFS drug efflux transporter [Histoplasma capsulatum var. duboisii H88]